MNDDDRIVAAIGGLRADLSAEIATLRADVGADIGGLRTELSAEIVTLRADVGADIGGLRADLSAEIVTLRADVGADIGGLRADMSMGFERVENKLTEIRDDIAVNFGATNAVRLLHDNTREELRVVNEQMSRLYIKLNRMDTRLRELEDGRR